MDFLFEAWACGDDWETACWQVFAGLYAAEKSTILLNILNKFSGAPCL